MTAATKGTFSEFKAVKTRGVVQIIIEVPVERADQALKALGGWPQAGEERWVAVARLDPGRENAFTTEPERDPEGQAQAIDEAWKRANEKPRRDWHDLPLSNQSGIACDDPVFETFLGEMHKPTYGNDALVTVADVVRAICNVQSRSEFDTDEEAGKRWTGLYGEFQAWKALG